MGEDAQLQDTTLSQFYLFLFIYLSSHLIISFSVPPWIS